MLEGNSEESILYLRDIFGPEYGWVQCNCELLCDGLWLYLVFYFTAMNKTVYLMRSHVSVVSQMMSPSTWNNCLRSNARRHTTLPFIYLLYKKSSLAPHEVWWSNYTLFFIEKIMKYSYYVKTKKWQYTIQWSWHLLHTSTHMTVLSNVLFLSDWTTGKSEHSLS